MRGLALLSGGLDSTLAVRLILDQGIDVTAVHFISPFCLCERGGCGASQMAKKFGIPAKVIFCGEDYLEVIRHPKYGYGKYMNPCIDCRIYMLKKAKKYAREIGAAFIFTGAVLEQRPMSQRKKALEIIEEKAGLKGKILRPLSAKLLSKTEAENEGWVDRTKLLGIRGKSRKNQLELIQEYSIEDYSCPSGGCLLTYKEFATKIRDLFKHKEHIELEDVLFLKVGRHFRFNENKIIVGRDEEENRRLLQLKNDSDYSFDVPHCGSPITLLQGPKIKEATEMAAALTAHYSDSREDGTLVEYGKDERTKSMIVSRINQEEVERLRIT